MYVGKGNVLSSGMSLCLNKLTQADYFLNRHPSQGVQGSPSSGTHYVHLVSTILGQDNVYVFLTVSTGLIDKMTGNCSNTCFAVILYESTCS